MLLCCVFYEFMLFRSCLGSMTTTTIMGASWILAKDARTLASSEDMATNDNNRFVDKEPPLAKSFFA